MKLRVLLALIIAAALMLSSATVTAFADGNEEYLDIEARTTIPTSRISIRSIPSLRPATLPIPI